MRKQEQKAKKRCATAQFDKLEFVESFNIVKEINNTMNSINNLFIFNCWSNISIMTKYYIVNIITIHMM